MCAYRFEIKNAKSACIARLSVLDVLLVMSFLSAGFILLLHSSYICYMKYIVVSVKEFAAESKRFAWLFH